MRNHRRNLRMVSRVTVRGFTMVELLVVFAVVAIVAVTILPALSRVQTKARTSKCLNNLKQIGTGTLVYLADMDEKLPYGSIRTSGGANNPNRVWTWDDLLHIYMGGHCSFSQLGNESITESDGAIDQFTCPSDRVALSAEFKRGAKRSYAMTQHQMKSNPAWSFATAAQAWPPNCASRSGVGLHWRVDQTAGGPNNGWNTEDPAPSFDSRDEPKHQPSVKTSIILDSSTTILVAEQINRENAQGNDLKAVIPNAENHLPGADFSADELHQQYFNYLMVDGHVEHLTPERTLGRLSGDKRMQSGMWTIAPDD